MKSGRSASGGERWASRCWVDDIVHVPFAANVVQRADMGMREGRDHAGFAVEPVAKLLVALERRREPFDGNNATRRRSRAQ